MKKPDPKTKKDKHPGRPVVFTAAEISGIRSRLEAIIEGLESVFDLTGKAARVDPQASCFLTIVKNDLLRLCRRFDKSLKRAKAGGAA